MYVVLLTDLNEKSSTSCQWYDMVSNVSSIESCYFALTVHQGVPYNSVD